VTEISPVVRHRLHAELLAEELGELPAEESFRVASCLAAACNAHRQRWPSVTAAFQLFGI